MFLFSILFLISLCAKAQTKEIEGHVYNRQNEPVLVFDVTAFGADSTMINADSYINGFFRLSIPEGKTASRLRIRSMGYKDLFMAVPEMGNDTLVRIPDIRLLEDTVLLKEVVVESRRPVIRLSGDSYIVDVAKTPLSKAGTFLDVARRVPGIDVSPRGNIQVMGKPRLLIHLNGREIHSVAELTALQSNQIKEIVIDRNPSSAYASSYDAVINVTTAEHIKNYMQLVASDDATFARRFSNNAAVSLNGKAGKVHYFTDLSYSDASSRQYDTEEKNLWTDTQDIYTHRSVDLSWTDRLLRFKQAIEFEIRPQDFIGVSYDLALTKHNMDRNQDFTYSLLNRQTAVPSVAKTDQDKVEHNPSVYFVHRGEKAYLGVFADYYKAKSDDNQAITENAQNEIPYLFSDRYHVAGFKVDYSRDFSVLSLSAGGKLSYIKDDGRYTSGNVAQQTSVQKSSSYAAYINVSKKINSFLFTAGLRFESEHAKSVSNDFVELDTTYNNLFPYFLVSYNNASGLKMALSYSKRINRPTYNQLISKRTYIDPLSYSIGNPLLRSTLVDVVSLSIQKNRFTAMLNFMHHSDKRAQIPLLEEQGGMPGIRFTYDNIPHMDMLQFYAMYYYRIGKIDGNSTLMLISSNMKYGQMRYARFKDIGVYARNNLEAPLWKSASLLLSMRYLNAQYNDLIFMKSSFNTSLYLSQNLCHDKLKLTLSAEDIFKTLKENNWTQKMPYSNINMMTNADSRSITFSVRYTFGNSKNQRHSSSTIQEDINRL